MDFMSGWSDGTDHSTNDDILELMKTCFWDAAHGGDPDTPGPRHCPAIAEGDDPMYGEN
jgi:hypothetical protein